MPKFQFRLKTLLAMHQSTRQERRAQLAEGLAAERDLEQAHAECRARAGRAGAIVSTARAVGEPSTSNDWRPPIDTEACCDRGWPPWPRMPRRCATEIEARQQALAEAEREVRVLDKLRERQHERFRYEQARREINAADEVATRDDLVADSTRPEPFSIAGHR